jgi:hypothetical protein
MKKRKYRKANKIHISSCYRFNPRKIHSELKEFLAWYELHESEFKFKLRPVSENAMRIEGVNPMINLVHDNCDFNIQIYWEGIYEELYSALVCPEKTEHGYWNLATIKEWRAVYFTEQALIECEAFERIRDWLNNKLPLHQWISFYRYPGISGTLIGAEKYTNEDTVGYVPIWSNYPCAEKVKN